MITTAYRQQRWSWAGGMTGIEAGWNWVVTVDRYSRLESLEP